MKFSRLQRKLGGWLGLDRHYWEKRSNGLYSLNFHRIGLGKDTPFDPCVFSCSTQELDEHLAFIKRHFTVITLAELESLVKRNVVPDRRYMCLTFDDGYIDNYTNALPVLKKHNLKASFFIATGLVGNNTVPWWDKIAYLIKHYNPQNLKLSDWEFEVLNKDGEENFIREILSAVKSCKYSAASQIEELEFKFSHSSGYPDAEFMNWEHLSSLLDEGMEVGAHSHNHDILTKLSDEELFYELSHSKALLEEKLACCVTAFSYPVGNKSTYNEKVIDGLRNTGYQIAFNFLPGVNVSPASTPYDLHRFPIAPNMNQEALKKMFSYTSRF
ncbi:polysaccharide deacetylase family protein [Alteromonas naphthalenivorans]|uniref:Polysaccharide deacetylase family protein n=1 Tax=Alteromonas naphthalenivorans TaxID=715451 RepID=F5ZAS0_ALTNA|nr:polysaccharide deacetylase family protein [Alteromonas naphthalenivorans]AEF02280.1 polysaccharide deacetylase family protein [Alteromonas naphthalenivorans]